MKKITTKKAVYWLLGETAGRTSVATWNWLWGQPAESGGKVAAEIAKESLLSMQEAVDELAAGVASVVATYERAKQQYNQKQSDFYEAEKAAQIAHNKGDQQAARLAITKAITIEKIIPQLKTRVDHAQAIMNKAKEKLRREQEKLQAYKYDLDNMKSLAEMNQAMADIGQFTSEYDLGSAKEQFAKAKNGIEKRNIIEEVKDELNNDSLETLQAETDLLSLEAEIEKRLLSLNPADSQANI